MGLSSGGESRRNESRIGCNPGPRIVQFATGRQGQSSAESLDPRWRAALNGAVVPRARWRLQRIRGFSEAVVHQNIVVFVVILNLTTGRDQPALITSSESRPRLRRRRSSLSRSGGRMKMLTALGILRFDLRGALHVDVEQQVVAVLLRPRGESGERCRSSCRRLRRARETRRGAIMSSNSGRETKKYSRPSCSLPRGRAGGVGDGEIEAGDGLTNFVDREWIYRSRRAPK